MRRSKTGALGRGSRGVAFDAPPVALPNVLGTIAKRLLDAADHGAGTVVVQDATIHAVAPTRGEFDAEDANIGASHKGRLKRTGKFTRHQK